MESRRDNFPFTEPSLDSWSSQQDQLGGWRLAAPLGFPAKASLQKLLMLVPHEEEIQEGVVSLWLTGAVTSGT